MPKCEVFYKWLTITQSFIINLKLYIYLGYWLGRGLASKPLNWPTIGLDMALCSDPGRVLDTDLYRDPVMGLHIDPLSDPDNGLDIDPSSEPDHDMESLHDPDAGLDIAPMGQLTGVRCMRSWSTARATGDWAWHSSCCDTGSALCLSAHWWSNRR